ncbi:hypothetical protein BJ912DRAFT_1140991 [Pholiota molesta]|nr:hypothetical protein BJ912DRAFT_1140991 [Pholiota molesta]
MDVDMKNKDDGEDKGIVPPSNGNGNGRDRDYDRDNVKDPRDRGDYDRERRDRDKDRPRDRDDRRDSGRARPRVGDHWEPERRNDRRRRSRSRSRSRSRRRSASPRRRRRSRSRSRTSRSRSPRSRSRSRDRKPSDTFSRSLGGPMNADHEEAVEFAKISKRENRVYVGNLSYDVKYRDLMEFMRGAGEVLFAEVLITPTGVSKGCGIVEFASPEDAQRAIRELSEQPLLGRPVFIREDRENEARFGATPVPGKLVWPWPAKDSTRASPAPPSHNYFGTSANPGNQLYVGNLPYQAGWQDLKDLPHRWQHHPVGHGCVRDPKDAQQAISMYHGFDWYGRTLEVREDRYAGLSGGGFRGGLRGGPRGSGAGCAGRSARRRLPRRVRGRRRDFSNQDLYADYSGPDQSGAGGGGVGRLNSYGGSDAGYGGGAGARSWTGSRANRLWCAIFLVDGERGSGRAVRDDGPGELAEILFDGTRSKGCGVVQFAQVGEAETAIAKFQQYMYGGRPLDVRFNDRWHTFTPSAAKGGQIAPMQAEGL